MKHKIQFVPLNYITGSPVKKHVLVSSVFKRPGTSRADPRLLGPLRKTVCVCVCGGGGGSSGYEWNAFVCVSLRLESRSRNVSLLRLAMHDCFSHRKDDSAALQ